MTLNPKPSTFNARPLCGRWNRGAAIPQGVLRHSSACMGFECRPFRAMITGVLPCSRSGAQLIGEVSRRDGGVCPIHRLAVNTDRVRVFHCSANRGRHPDATAADSELISPFCARTYTLLSRRLILLESAKIRTPIFLQGGSHRKNMFYNILIKPFINYCTTKSYA